MARATKAGVQIAVAELRERLRNTKTAKQFGFELAEASPGRAVLRMRVDERHKQRDLRWKVRVNRASGQACLLRNLVESDLGEPACGEQRPRRSEDRLAIPRLPP